MTVKSINITKVNTQNDYSVQYKVAIAVSLSMATIGIHFGWIGPTLLILTDPEKSPILIKTGLQTVFLANSLYIGALLGPFLCPYLTRTIGRQKTLLYCTVPNLVSFSLIMCATNVATLYIARIVGGIAVSVVTIVSPIYISEIASPNIRGKLGIIQTICLVLGNGLEFFLVPFMSIRLNAMICFLLALIQGIILYFIPDTPYFHISKNNEHLAEQTLKYFRNTNCVKKELDEVQAGWIKQKQDVMTVGMFDVFQSKHVRKAMGISLIIFMGQQYSGFTALNTYRQLLLKDAEGSISPELAGILITITTFVFIIVGIFLIDKWGRKPLFIFSVSGAGVSLFIIGVYFFAKSLHYKNISDFSLTPFFGLILYAFTVSIGLLSLPHIVSSEILPTKYKSKASSLLVLFSAVNESIVNYLYQMLSVNFGNEYALWFFTLCCVISVIACVFVMPETKGKSLEQIQNELHYSINGEISGIP